MIFKRLFVFVLLFFPLASSFAGNYFHYLTDGETSIVLPEDHDYVVHFCTDSEGWGTEWKSSIIYSLAEGSSTEYSYNGYVFTVIGGAKSWVTTKDYIMIDMSSQVSLVIDTDGDGIPDVTDPDDDNDGLNDEFDPFPLDPLGDLDGDGIIDANDADIDGDGIPFYADTDDTVANYDLDGDGTSNRLDPDIDGDGLANKSDPFPYNPNGDYDGDGIADGSDPDMDGDGILNGSDTSLSLSGGSSAFSGGAGSYSSNGISSAISGEDASVYVKNLDGVETSLKAIREGLSQSLDVPISDLSQISQSTLDELKDLGISEDKAVGYLFDIGITLEELRAHQNDGSAAVVAAIETIDISVPSVPVSTEQHDDLVAIKDSINQLSGDGEAQNTEYIDSVVFENPVGIASTNQAVVSDINGMDWSGSFQGFIDGMREKLISAFTINIPDIGKKTSISFDLPSYLGIQLPPLAIDLTKFGGFVEMLRHVLVITVGINAVRYCMTIFNATFQ